PGGGPKGAWRACRAAARALPNPGHGSALDLRGESAGRLARFPPAATAGRPAPPPVTEPGPEPSGGCGVGPGAGHPATGRWERSRAVPGTPVAALRNLPALPPAALAGPEERLAYRHPIGDNRPAREVLNGAARASRR